MNFSFGVNMAGFCWDSHIYNPITSHHWPLQLQSPPAGTFHSHSSLRSIACWLALFLLLICNIPFMCYHGNNVLFLNIAHFVCLNYWSKLICCFIECCGTYFTWLVYKFYTHHFARSCWVAIGTYLRFSRSSYTYSPPEDKGAHMRITWSHTLTYSDKESDCWWGVDLC